MSEKILDIPEPDHKNLLNTNGIKKMIGGEVLYARELNPNTTTVPLFQFGVVLTLHGVPFFIPDRELEDN